MPPSPAMRTCALMIASSGGHSRRSRSSAASGPCRTCADITKRWPSMILADSWRSLGGRLICNGRCCQVATFASFSGSCKPASPVSGTPIAISADSIKRDSPGECSPRSTTSSIRTPSGAAACRRRASSSAGRATVSVACLPSMRSMRRSQISAVDSTPRPSAGPKLMSGLG